MGLKEHLTLEPHRKIAQRAMLMVRVAKLLQDGGFGDSSDEEGDEEAASAATSCLRRNVAVAATSPPSDTPPPSPRPLLAPQARAFMAGKGLEAWVTEDEMIVVDE